MRQAVQFSLVLAGVCAVLGAAAIAGILWLRSQPDWRLSASNTATGVTVKITDTTSVDPIYTIHIAGTHVKQPISNVLRTELKSDDVTTSFYDVTVPPGRWTVNVHGTKLDIMPEFIVVNEKITAGRGAVLEVE